MSNVLCFVQSYINPCENKMLLSSNILFDIQRGPHRTRTVLNITVFAVFPTGMEAAIVKLVDVFKKYAGKNKYLGKNEFQKLVQTELQHFITVSNADRNIYNMWFTMLPLTLYL